MKILVVNDDGIHAPGIAVLARLAQRIGEVTVVAPAAECSAMSQRVSIYRDMEVCERTFAVPGVRAWSVDGTPADCVKLALAYLLPQRPDLVLSGINNGFNAGFDIAYSGTIGAAMEGLMSGIPAAAFSCGYGYGTGSAEAFADAALGQLMNCPAPANCIWNFNFPGSSAADVSGVRFDASIAPLSYYRDAFVTGTSPNGMPTYSLQGNEVPADAAPDGSDVNLLLRGFVTGSLVPCRVL